MTHIQTQQAVLHYITTDTTVSLQDQ